MADAMRVLYLHQHFSTPAGATATRSYAVARALAARGHQVTIACGSYAGGSTGLTAGFEHGRREGRVGPFQVVEFDIPCANAMPLGTRGRAFLHYAWAATGLALRQPWDLVVASSTPLTVAVPALLARRLRGTPFVFEIRDPWPELPRAMAIGHPWLWSAMDWLADRSCRRAAAVIALSDGIAATALAHGATAEAVHVIPNGCDLDLFGPQVAPWRPPQAQSQELLAIYAGAHGPANHLDTLLDAAAWLRDRGERRLRLLLAGDGADKPRLAARAAAMRLPNLDFLEALPKRRLAALLAGSQVGLHCAAPVPEFAEWTAPNKVMDYLAAGLPVVSTQPGMVSRLLAGEARGPCGVVVPPGDGAALGAALLHLVGDPARRRGMALAARDLAVRRWDRRLLAERACAVLEDAAARPGRQPMAVPA